jgi:hypothetical protein
MASATSVVDAGIVVHGMLSAYKSDTSAGCSGSSPRTRSVGGSRDLNSSASMKGWVPDAMKWLVA